MDLLSSDIEKIYATIQTPQFKNGKVWKMQKQSGVFDVRTLKFSHDGIFSGHDVQFHSIEDFHKSVVVYH